MADTSFDVIIIGSGPGGYVTAIRAAPARLQDRDRREILSRRHLPELGLHPDQGAAALGRNLPLHAARQGLRPVRRKRSRSIRRPWCSARAASRSGLNDGVGFLMKKNKVSGDLGRGLDRRARQGHGEEVRRRERRRARWARAPTRPSTSSSRPARGRACCRGSSPTRSWSGPISRRWCRSGCRSRCWWSAPARSASSSPRSSTPWAPTSPWSRCCRRSSRSRMPRSPAWRASASRSRASRSCTSTKVTKLEKKADSVVATIDDGKGKPQTVEFERVISAVGVVGNIEDLGLEKLGVEDRPRLRRDRRLRQDQRPRHLRDRRRRRSADAGAQGRA